LLKFISNSVQLIFSLKTGSISTIGFINAGVGVGLIGVGGFDTFFFSVDGGPSTISLLNPRFEFKGTDASFAVPKQAPILICFDIEEFDLI